MAVQPSCVCLCDDRWKGQEAVEPALTSSEGLEKSSMSFRDCPKWVRISPSSSSPSPSSLSAGGLHGHNTRLRCHKMNGRGPAG